MRENLVAFDMADFLNTEEAVAEYLTQVFADGDYSEILVALGHIAKAKGIGRIAKDTGLGRESLYKALAPGAKPRFETVFRVMGALGLRLSALPASDSDRATPKGRSTMK